MKASIAILFLLQVLQAPGEAGSDAFEVVSVKANHTGGSYGMRITPGGRFTASNVTPLMLVRRAFGIELFQLAGAPDWMDAERYDVEARTTGARDITSSELQPLLQSLLAERFGLKVHREGREMPIYSLVILAKNGNRLAAHTGEGSPSLTTDFATGKATIIASNTTMEAFAAALSRLPGRPVSDHTGLKGGFDFKLEWSPDQTSDLEAPSLFAAVQEQLGLKLESTRGPVEVVVIDHAEKPSGN